jgi:hypothetical protein
MSAALIQGSLCWRLHVNDDPPPGRDAERTVPNARGDAESAARNDLQVAPDWAAAELGDDYVVRES